MAHKKKAHSKKEHHKKHEKEHEHEHAHVRAKKMPSAAHKKSHARGK